MRFRTFLLHVAVGLLVMGAGILYLAVFACADGWLTEKESVIFVMAELLGIGVMVHASISYLKGVPRRH